MMIRVEIYGELGIIAKRLLNLSLRPGDALLALIAPRWFKI